MAVMDTPMVVMTDTLIPALKDAREAHADMVDRFRADVTITPPGPYRQMLERQVIDVQDNLERIDDHVRQLQPSDIVDRTVDVTRSLARSAVRMAKLPLTIASTVVTRMLTDRQPAHERRLLKNTEDEYAVTARALAASRAGESIAEQVHDQATIDLLASLRRLDQQLLQTLDNSVAQHAQAVVAATDVRPRPSGGLAEAATRAVRTAFHRLQDATRTGGRRTMDTAAGMVREMPDATRIVEGVQGAVTREQDLPIPDFSQLSVSDVQDRLRTLSQSDLTVIEGYERAHANRAGVLDAIEQLRGSEPWPAYDTLDADQVIAQLQNVSSSVARQVLEYEHRHRSRPTIISAAEARVPM